MRARGPMPTLYDAGSYVKLPQDRMVRRYCPFRGTGFGREKNPCGSPLEGDEGPRLPVPPGILACTVHQPLRRDEGGGIRWALRRESSCDKGLWNGRRRDEYMISTDPGAMLAKLEGAFDFAQIQVRHLVEKSPGYFPMYTAGGKRVHGGERWTPWCEGFLPGVMWVFTMRYTGYLFA